jgi:hypothetical protein
LFKASKSKEKATIFEIDRGVNADFRTRITVLVVAQICARSSERRDTPAIQRGRTEMS